MVEPIDEILQGLSLSLPESEKLDVRLRPVEHTYKLAYELLAELFEITDQSGLQIVEPLCVWAFYGTRKG